MKFCLFLALSTVVFIANWRDQIFVFLLTVNEFLFNCLFLLDREEVWQGETGLGIVIGVDKGGPG
jgi:hypothetical protein